MSDAKYVVILKGRPAPILLKASGLRLVGGELRLLQSGEVVAGGPDVEFAAHLDAIPGGEVGAANLLGEPPRPMPSHLAPPPPPAMRSIKAKAFKFKSKRNPSPRWPFLAGLALGSLVGVMGMLVFAIV
ncbi:hypothetical protein QYE47_23170 [Pseudomonas sp. 2,4-D]|uniref:hypothetical protein n=1 Tax=Pseudomonas sp. 2,4-D TaxID=3058433 RepID=UPI0026165FDF|nr:hypothetical protein [Pseudomonas sp. 2,4-D]MDN4515426.1 hypothetical protein [Pseudomonas sp. 2,4-D]